MGFGKKLSFSSASLTAALLTSFYNAKAEFFYIVELKMDPVYYSVAIAIWAVWNAVNDPLAGWYMDHKPPTRWGRRFPYMVVFWIPLAISFGLIWSPPESFFYNSLYLMGWLVLMLIIFDTAYTFVILAWASLFPELFTTDNDRGFVSALRQVWSLIALVLALVIPPFFIQDGKPHSYTVFGWVLALVTFINIGISLYGCREDKATIPEQNHYTLREGWHMLKTNRSFQVFLIANMVGYFSYGQTLSMLSFYRKFILHQDYSFEVLVYGAVVGVTFFAVFLWVLVTNKKDARFTFIASTALFTIALVPLLFLTDIPTIVIEFGFAGLSLAGILMVVDLLLSDIIDLDFIETNKRREGLFFGINGFFIRGAVLLRAISLAIVAKTTGFDETNSTVQTPLAQFGIKIQMLILPIVANIIAIYIIWKYYSLHGDRLKEIKDKVKAKVLST